VAVNDESEEKWKWPWSVLRCFPSFCLQKLREIRSMLG